MFRMYLSDEFFFSLQAHSVLYQYTELLYTALSQESYATLIPSLGDLCVKYGLESSVAFHLLRPAYEKPVTVRTLPQDCYPIVN